MGHLDILQWSFKMLDPNTSLSEAFEKAENSTQFLDFIIKRVAKVVDELDSVKDESDGRQFSRKLTALRFVADLVESKKKSENTGVNLNFEKIAEQILSFFLTQLIESMKEVKTEDFIQQGILRSLKNKVSKIEAIKSAVENKEAA